MSLVRFDRSPDLQHLRDDGYTVSVEETGYVLVSDVPYVTAAKAVERGILAYPVRASGNSAGPPDNHVVFFAGDVPHQSNGKPFGFHSPAGHVIAQDLVANLQLSYKDPTHPVDADLYVKFKRYITLLEQHAQ